MDNQKLLEHYLQRCPEQVSEAAILLIDTAKLVKLLLEEQGVNLSLENCLPFAVAALSRADWRSAELGEEIEFSPNWGGRIPRDFKLEIPSPYVVNKDDEEGQRMNEEFFRRQEKPEA